MNNMLDMYLSMNSCVLDKENNIYYIELNTAPKLVGKYISHKITNNTLIINMKLEEGISLINVEVNNESA